MSIRPRAALLAAALATTFTCAAVAAPAQPAGARQAAHGAKHVTKAHARKVHAKGAAKTGHAVTAKHAKKARTSQKLHQAAAKRHA